MRVEVGEPWANVPGEYFALAQKRLSRQRVTARNRPENQRTQSTESECSTRGWWRRWLSWFLPAAAGERA
jgi:hypothetical protein